MTRPYPMNLPEPLVIAVEPSQSYRAVATLFNLGPATVGHWVKLEPDSFRLTRSLSCGGSLHILLV